MSENVIYSINCPVVKIKNAKDFSMLEMVYVGHAKLMGEVISISKDLTTIQVYETTTGLKSLFQQKVMISKVQRAHLCCSRIIAKQLNM